MRRIQQTPHRPAALPVREAMLAAPASVIGSIVLPSVLITVHALRTADAASTTAFAISVAEPLALVGAGLVVAWLAQRAAGRPSAGRWRAGLVVGCAAALGMVAAALWVHDVDRWTAAAAVGLPLLGALVARRGAAAGTPDGVVPPPGAGTTRPLLDAGRPPAPLLDPDAARAVAEPDRAM